MSFDGFAAVEDDSTLESVTPDNYYGGDSDHVDGYHGDDYHVDGGHGDGGHGDGHHGDGGHSDGDGYLSLLLRFEFSLCARLLI